MPVARRLDGLAAPMVVNAPPRVLVVRFSSLGDVVLVTAALEALREELPGAHVAVLTKPGFREIFRGHPAVSEVVDWNPAEGLPRLASRLRSGRYDWIVDLHANLRSRVLRLLVPGPRWSVYDKGAMRRRGALALGRRGLLDGSRHVVDRYLQALAPLGVGSGRRLPRVVPAPEAAASVARALRGAGWVEPAPLVALAPGARWATKAWPRRHWADLLRRLDAEGTGFPVLLGGADEAELCGRLLSETGVAGASLAGRTALQETAAALRLARVLVTNDSAPLHLAVGVGTPVVALFGPTVPEFGFYPLGSRDVVLSTELRCRPCALHGSDACRLGGEPRCMTGISVEAVLAALRARLG